MPKYEVNKDGAHESLDPEGSNAKVTFDKNEVRPREKKSRTKTIVVISLVIICLIIVLLLCAWFVYTIIDTRPEWQKENFTIETIPGFRYHPEDYGGETIIIYNASSPKSYRTWSVIIDKQLEDYIKLSDEKPLNSVDCDYDRPPASGEVCIQEIQKWFPCVKHNNYGWHKSSPCVFIRFNKILDWVPEFYDDEESLPEDMPEDLKKLISNQRSTFHQLGKTVWLSCKGELPVDTENAGLIHYLPRRGFPGYFFPYNNTENYLSPLVAIHFDKPQKGIVISIECRLWAKNIKYDREKGTGFVHFELMVDY